MKKLVSSVCTLTALTAFTLAVQPVAYAATTSASPNSTTQISTATKNLKSKVKVPSDVKNVKITESNGVIVVTGQLTKKAQEKLAKEDASQNASSNSAMQPAKNMPSGSDYVSRVWDFTDDTSSTYSWLGPKDTSTSDVHSNLHIENQFRTYTLRNWHIRYMGSQTWSAGDDVSGAYEEYKPATPSLNDKMAATKAAQKMADDIAEDQGSENLGGALTNDYWGVGDDPMDLGGMFYDLML